MGHAAWRVALAVSLWSSFAFGQTPQKGSKEEMETLEVCSNLNTYVVLSLRARASRLPLENARKLAVAAMNARLNVPDDIKSAYIEVVQELYGIVYANESVTAARADEAIAEACSKYKGFNVSQQTIREHLARNPLSAWNPTERVSLCLKGAQVAANLVVYRDKGGTRKEAESLVNEVLGDDRLTLAKAPQMLEEVYGVPGLKVPAFFAYNLFKCQAVERGASFRPLTELTDGLERCQSISTEAERNQCFRALLM